MSKDKSLWEKFNIDQETVRKITVSINLSCTVPPCVENIYHIIPQNQFMNLHVTVCQLSGEPRILMTEWENLVDHTIENRTDLVLLPEMPFFPWICSREEVSEDLWDLSIQHHEKWLEKFDRLETSLVVLTIPTREANGQKHNLGIAWSEKDGVIPVHTKFYLPNEQGFWEENWYNRGDGKFDIIKIGSIRIGFLICTELWFMQHAREYCKQDIDLLVCPRSTEAATVDKWVMGGQVAGVISGGFSVSSNHHGLAPDNTTKLGGVGWIADMEGNLIAKTSIDNPVVTRTIDITRARKAKSSYPRYVNDEIANQP